MWQAEADTELTLSASPATAVGQSKLYPGESMLEYGSISEVHMSAYLRRDVKVRTISEVTRRSEDFRFGHNPLRHYLRSLGD